MPSIESIHNKLIELDASTFQRLGDEYFEFCSQLTIRELKPIGLAPGKRAPKTGTPDTLIILDSEKYILVEYTTKKRTEKKSEYLKKLKTDLIKCQNPKLTGISLKDTKEIILASSHVITIKDRKEILAGLKAKNISVSFFDLDYWGREIKRHSFLAHKYLNLPVETKQVLTINEFIAEYERGGLSTPLSNQFLHRSTELTDAAASIKDNPVYVLSGPAGVGKTKLALECITQYQHSHPGIQVLCLKDKGSFSLDDIRTHFFPNKSYLIFIDDANRCARILDYAVNSILEGMHIQLVLTVRDYGLKEIELVLRALQPKVEKIKPFDDIELTDIVLTIANFNRVAINKILSLAMGNPRIALMAARITKETNTLKSITNAAEIFDQYFSNVIAEKQTFSSSKHLKCLGILSVFRSINLSSEEGKKILRVFQIDNQMFWDVMSDLEDIEFVEIEGDLVRITEQNLQSYSFYKAFLVEKRLSIATLLTEFFPTHHLRIKDIIISVNNTFDYSNIREKTNSALLSKLRTITDEKEKILFFDCFWFYCPNQLFQFVKEHIASLPLKKSEEQSKIDSIHLTSKYFRLLIDFLNYNNEDFLVALQLLIAFTKKSPNHTSQLADIIKGRVTYSDDSYPKYEKQETYLKLITSNWNKHRVYQELFFKTANQFLYAKFTVNAPTHKRNSISLTQHAAPLNSSLKKHRKLIWTFIDTRFKDEPAEFTKVLTHYADYRIDLIKGFVEYDLSFLSKIVLQKYDNTDLVQLLSAARIRDLVIKLKMKGKLGVQIKERLLSSEVYKTYTTLSWARDPVRQDFKAEVDKYVSYKSDLVIKAFKSLDINQVEQLVSFVNSWSFQIGDHYSNGMSVSLDILARYYLFSREYDKTWVILLRTMEPDNPSKFIPYRTIEFIGKTPELHDTYLSLLQGQTFQDVVVWMGIFIQSIEENKVTEELADKLRDLIEEQDRGFYFDFDWIQSLQKHRPNIYAEILTQLYRKWKKDKSRIVFPRDFFIESKSYGVESTLLEDAYIMQYLLIDTFDYSGKGFRVLIEVNEAFLIKFCKAVFGQKYFRGSKDSSFIKGLAEHPKLNTLATQFLNFLSSNDHLYPDDFYSSLSETFVHSGMNFQEFMKEYLTKNAKNLRKVKIVMEVVKEIWRDQASAFLRIFLKHNSKVKDFKEINWSVTGGFFSGRTNVFGIYHSKWLAVQTILKEFSSIKYLDHKLFVDEMVYHYELSALQESKELFLKRSPYDD